ncbi:hypothetical protein GCM10023318_54010 [Nocardia callitridis]|uniref:Uncharacterized protein n=2 Tax=Nocardia callitridis TaxID=648753 RepID=A0ABP9KY62_9NOCA
MSAAARRELLILGIEGSATISERWQRRSEPGYVFRVWVRLDGKPPYETRACQQVSDADLARMRPGENVRCRVDPRDEDRLVLYVPAFSEAARCGLEKILADGRRADAKVLSTAPVSAEHEGLDAPLVRLDLELTAWDEPTPWHTRVTQPVPLTAMALLDRGRRLEVAFFTVDQGESVAIDWQASLT